MAKCQAWQMRQSEEVQIWPLFSLDSQFGIEGVAQSLDLVTQAIESFDRYACVPEDRRAQAGSPLLEGPAALGQFDEHLTLVGGIAGALHEARRLQALQQGSQRATLDAQPLADVADGEVVLLPQYVQQEVLGIGDAQLVQQRLVGALD